MKEPARKMRLARYDDPSGAYLDYPETSKWLVDDISQTLIINVGKKGGRNLYFVQHFKWGRRIC